MSRTKLVVGNWKMNLSVPESTILLEKYAKTLEPKHTELVICPSFIDIYSANEVLNGTEIGVGAQNVFYEDAGAFTGEVSAHQLKGFAEYAIVGHSERRHLFGEDDKIVAKKAAACVQHKIRPIVCVGERLHEKMDGLTNLVISSQLEASLSNLTPAEVAEAVIAYEPVWAIGTGHFCEPKKANEVAGKIRNLVKVLYGEKSAEKVRVLYGGSLDEKNVKGFLGCSNIDGFLVGGSSLKQDVFTKIVEEVDGGKSETRKTKDETRKTKK